MAPVRPVVFAGTMTSDLLRDVLAPPEPAPEPLTHVQLVDLALTGRRLPGEPEPVPTGPAIPAGPRGTVPGGDFLRGALQRARR